jgi:hypothetical protein
MFKGKAKPMVSTETSGGGDPFATGASLTTPVKRKTGGFKLKVAKIAQRLEETIEKIEEMEKEGYMPTCTPLMKALKERILAELVKLRGEMVAELKEVAYLCNTLENRVKVQMENGKIKRCQSESNNKLLERVQGDMAALAAEVMGD